MTRGAWGFIKNSKKKIIYSNSDSYPVGLGLEVKNFIIQYYKKLSKIFDNLIEPELDEPEHLYFSIDNPSEKYFTNAEEFLNYPLFCEWAYIINLDTNKLEVYCHKTKDPTWTKKDSMYLALIKNVSFKKIIDFKIENLTKKLRTIKKPQTQKEIQRGLKKIRCI